LRRLVLARRDLLGDFGEPPTNPRTDQSSNNGSIEFDDNFLGRLFGYPKPLPDRNIKSREPRLVHRRNVRCGCQPGLTPNTIGSDFASTYVRQRIRRLVDHEVKLPSQHILHCGRDTANVCALPSRLIRLVRARWVSSRRHRRRATSLSTPEAASIRCILVSRTSWPAAVSV